MTMVAHRMGPILGLITALLVSSICMKNTEAQQSAAGIPSGEAKKPQTEATLFPVPDFTADIWTRAKLTGDWLACALNWRTTACNSTWITCTRFRASAAAVSIARAGILVTQRSS